VNTHTLHITSVVAAIIAIFVVLKLVEDKLLALM